VPDKEFEKQEEDFLAYYEKLARQIQRLRRNTTADIRAVNERIRVVEDQLDDTGNN